MRLRWALAGLLLIPLADSAFLIVVADWLGWPATVALVVLTGLLGTLLVRAEGRNALRGASEKLRRGEPPADELLDGALLVAAGAFLLTPGLVTDAIGFVLALPPTRAPVRLALKRYVVVPYLDGKVEGFVAGSAWTGGFPDAGETVDLDPEDYRDTDEESGGKGNV
ncbi:MAG: FxsA family protein [Haloferacaceae archaeon]